MKRVITEFTQEGYDLMKQEYEALQEQRKHAVTQLSIARAQGDLSENAAYTAARRKLSSVDYQIRTLSRLLKSAVIIAKPTNGEIGLGSNVVVSDGTRTLSFCIVGGAESDLSKGKISQFSPLGKNLMHKKPGDSIVVSAPAGKIQYQILEVS